MIGSQITVTWGGVQRTAPLTAAVVVAFERTYNIGWNALYAAQPGTAREEWELWIAWEAMRRAGHGPKLFDEWLNEVESGVSVSRPPVVGQGPLSETP